MGFLSGVSVTTSFTFSLNLSVGGSQGPDGAHRYWSENCCPIECVRCGFGVSNYNIRPSPVGAYFRFSVNNGHIVLNGVDGYVYHVVNDVGFTNCVLNRGLALGNQGGQGSCKGPITGYCGEDICFIVRFANSKDWSCFYLKGGQPSVEDSRYVDSENFGHLFYCGENVEPNPSGGEFFTVNVIPASGRVEFPNSVSGADTDFRLNTNPHGVDDCVYDMDCETDYSFLETCEIPEDSDDDDEIVNCEYDKCDISIDDCCADEQFTSDLNVFSGLTNPDTYINPDSGEEERLPWNGLMHLCEIIRCGFKVAFVCFTKALTLADCHLKNFEKLLSDINDSLKKLADKDNEDVNQIIVDAPNSVYVGKAHYDFTDDE